MSNIGIVAAQIVGERASQLTMRTFHCNLKSSMVYYKYKDHTALVTFDYLYNEVFRSVREVEGDGQLEKHITSNTRAIIFSSPSNPTGKLYSREELASIAAVIAKYPQIIVISDEIYEHINFVGKHESIAQFEEIRDRVVIINGVSKGYAMTGWRIGYIGAPIWIAKAVEKLQGQFTSGACTIAQKASEAALNAGNQSCLEMTAIFKKRRDLVIDLLKEIPGLKINIPEGAFYVFPDISAYIGQLASGYTITDGDSLAMYLLEKANVACVGGNSFGSPECLRLSYATSEDLIIESIKRIKVALSELK